MRREVKKYLFDVAEASEEILEFTRGKTLNDYMSDRLLRRAVERQFITVGEAMNHAIQLDDESVSRLSHSSRIVGFRNQLVHGYKTVADDIVWDIVQRDLPVLKSEVDRLLAG